MKEYLAVVVDNNDSDKLSRVQVRILPEMVDVEESKLPWAQPRTPALGHADGNGVHRPPEIGSYVHVLADEWFTKFWYTDDAFIQGYAVYEEFSTPSEIGTQTYPQPRFQVFADGTVFFINTETGEKGIISSTGAKIIIDGDGQIILKNGSGEITLKSSGQLDVNGNLTVDA